jgi:hypothetical protein
MNTKILGFLAAMLAEVTAANAQTNTLEYQGDAISGISSYWPSGFTNPNSLPTSAFVGSLTAAITLSGSASANNLALVAYDFNFNGSNFIGSSGASFSLDLPTGPAPYSNMSTELDFCSAQGCIDLTTASNGAIDGAVVDINSAAYHASEADFAITAGGDSLSYLYATTNGTCQNLTPGAGPTVNPCSLSGRDSTAGTWIASSVPEIDTGSAGAGLALLLGSLLVLHGRRLSTRLPN